MYGARWNMRYIHQKDMENWRQRFFARIAAPRWTNAGGLIFRHMPSTTPVSCLQYDSHRKCIISGSEAGTVKVFSLDTREEIHSMRISDSTVRRLLLNGSQLLVAAENSYLQLWDVVSGCMIREFTGQRQVETVAFVRDEGSNVFSFATGTFNHS